MHRSMARAGTGARRTGLVIAAAIAGAGIVGCTETGSTPTAFDAGAGAHPSTRDASGADSSGVDASTAGASTRVDGKDAAAPWEACADPEIEFGEGMGWLVGGDEEPDASDLDPGLVCIHDADGNIVSSYEGHGRRELIRERVCVFSSEQTSSGRVLLFHGFGGSDESFLLPPQLEDPESGEVLGELTIQNRFYAESGADSSVCDEQEPILYLLVEDYGSDAARSSYRLEAVDLSGALSVSIDLPDDDCTWWQAGYQLVGRGGVLQIIPEDPEARSCTIHVRSGTILRGP